jgi:hypothetical protein
LWPKWFMQRWCLGFKSIGGLFQATEPTLCLLVNWIDLQRQIHQLFQKFVPLLQWFFKFL